jgi:hypothetical protein
VDDRRVKVVLVEDDPGAARPIKPSTPSALIDPCGACLTRQRVRVGLPRRIPTKP